MTPFERYRVAEQALNQGLIRLNRSLNQDKLPVSDPVAKIKTMRAFAEALGNPQHGIPAVHVAGTSGKGSVSAAIAALLSKAGFRVGLHVSPYLQAAVEKIWIDGSYVSADAFADAAEFILPTAKLFLHPDTPGSVHGMAQTALALELFRRSDVDVMVFEAGCGGRFDLSSVVESCVSVVTNVGMDHVRTLGPTLKDIAWHKAGVARAGVPLVTGASGEALTVVREEGASVGAPLFEIPRTENVFAHNREIARVAAERAAEILGRPLPADLSAQPLPLPGRSERMPGEGPLVILDGAHNPDKLSAAVQSALAQATDGPRFCVFGLLGAKAGPDVAAVLRGKFDSIFVTEPSVYGKPSAKASDVATLLDGVGCPVTVAADPFGALEAATSAAGTGGTVLVTGSFYLAGALRERFYPTEQVVLQRTSFPVID